ncbi:MAG: DUF418 domain-containing protein [Isosphaeraceae bacterium]|nr:DUF418 domain-containing protein [Isosphaeraceae bacterium]
MTVDSILSESTAAPAVTPVGSAERVQSIDVLRGVALLGILLMNILEFGLPLGAELNPSIAGGDKGLNLAAWVANHVLFEGKMRAIFSMLFGAGAVLITSRPERRGGGIELADIYYRRTLWLIAFGLAHAYLLWEGDILFTYGLFGLVLFPLRNVKPWYLIAAGLLLLAPLTPGCLRESMEIRSLRKKAAEAAAVAAAGRPLTDRQQEDRFAWKEKLKGLHQDPGEIAEEYKDHRGSYWRLFLRRTRVVPGTQSSDLYRFGVFDALGMMLLGMGLLKLGVFSAELRSSTYIRLLSFGYGVGVPLNALTGYLYYRSGFDPAYLMTHYAIYQYGRLLVALGHIGVVMLVVKASVLPRLTTSLAAVGRTALTNYLGTSLVCTVLFNGYGFGLFGRLQRVQLLGVVLAVWATQLVVSPLWLRVFRFGPVEWLWRSLTYGRRQPMIRSRESRVPVQIV